MERKFVVIAVHISVSLSINYLYESNCGNICDNGMSPCEIISPFCTHICIILVLFDRCGVCLFIILGTYPPIIRGLVVEYMEEDK